MRGKDEDRPCNGTSTSAAKWAPDFGRFVEEELTAFLDTVRAAREKSSFKAVAGSDGSEDVHALLPLAESAWAAEEDSAEESDA